MKAEQARLKRLQRLERLRDIAKQAAAAEAARAESTLAQLQSLAERTSRLADDYAANRTSGDGWALSQWGRFAAGLNAVRASTAREADHARAQADEKLSELGRAERSRQVVEERMERQARVVAEQRAPGPAIGARRPRG